MYYINNFSVIYAGLLALFTKLLEPTSIFDVFRQWFGYTCKDWARGQSDQLRELFYLPDLTIFKNLFLLKKFDSKRFACP